MARPCPLFFMIDVPALAGFGLGLRAPHYETVLATRPAVDWFEIISENFMHAHEGYWEFLGDLRRDYAFVMHGVSLSIGGTDALDIEYLARHKRLVQHLRPAVISDHLCFTGLGGHNTHDLLPLPYTAESLAHVATRVQQVQDYLGCQLVLENPSSYLEFAHSTLPEWEFLAELANRTGCGLLLDVNNIYVSAFNHGFATQEYLAALPPQAVIYMHLAGHRNLGTHIVDTHDESIIPPVWQLYAEAIRCFGAKPTMIERDDKIPEFAELLQELALAKTMCAEASHAPVARRA